MKNFHRSLTFLDGMIAKLERNFGVLNKVTDSTIHAPAPVQEKSKIETIPKEQLKAETQIKEEKGKDSKTTKAPKPQNKNAGSAKPLNEFFELFKTAELRVGEIIEAKPLPDSDKLYIERINMGDHERTILSGLQKFIPIEGISGKVIVFCNLKPRKLAGQESNGMVLATSDESHAIVELLRPNPNAKIGELVSLDDAEADHSLTEFKAINPKNFEKFLNLLHTDEQGAAMFENYFMKTISGRLSASSIRKGNIR
jgi:methionine--tRNA ligase beta chain